METLVVNNFVLSGYGDRMMDLLLLASYARARNMRLYIRWQDFPGMPDYSDIPEWRFQDTRLKNFLSFFRLPSEVQIEYTSVANTAHEWKQYIGGTTSPTVFHERYIAGWFPIGLSEWLAIVDEVKSELKLKVTRYVPERPYVTVHLRRTDKLRGVCETQIVKDELALLNQETFAAIQTAKDSGYTDFYIATDDPSARGEYIAFIESIGCRVIAPANDHKLLSSYFDTWMMKSTSIIIASMRYSTFSLFPSLWWDIPLWTVLPDSLHSVHKFNATYYKNVQLGN